MRVPDPSTVRAPLHGVVTVLVEPGQQVRSGQLVAVLEAMKMEAPVTAPRDGTVSRVEVPSPGTQVAGGDLLLVID